MLQKTHRIRRSAFSPISAGKPLFSPLFSVKYRKNIHTISRFSVVVSKKVEKTAVGRNLLKRRVYSVLKMAEKEPIQAIFYLKKESKGADFKTLESEVLRCVRLM